MMSPMVEAMVPLRTVHATAPVRICDNGGWTDTWVAGHGQVCNIAVTPGVEVEVTVHPAGALGAPVVLHATNYGERYGFEPGSAPGRHPLLETTVGEIGVPVEASVEIAVASAVPPGCSTGTSAAVTVALVGALDHLRDGSLTPHQVAVLAHRIEVDRLGNQSGVQDQLCAAHGGVSYIEVSPYPHATVTRLPVPEGAWRALDQRLLLVYLGRPHLSSALHEAVIAALERDTAPDNCLEDLRRAAEAAKEAVVAGDLVALGRAMTANTAAQQRLHPGLVSPQARAVMEVATAHGALGCKVNGAGGEGGSITVLGGIDDRGRAELLEALRRADALVRVIPVSLSRHGLRVWEAPADNPAAVAPGSPAAG